jgi:membrane-associated phospholipid phosphatase
LLSHRFGKSSLNSAVPNRQGSDRVLVARSSHRLNASIRAGSSDIEGAYRHRRLPLVDRRRTLATLGMLLGAFLVLTVLVGIDPSDPPVLGGIDRAWRDGGLDAPAIAVRISRALKALGSGWVMVPVRLAVAAWLLATRRRTDLAVWLIAWALADAATAILKPAIGRPQPNGSDTTSFPSAHAKTAAQVAVALALILTRPRTRARASAWGAAVVWIVAMAASRTVLDEHWLSDVVAGSMLGAGCVVAALLLAPLVASEGREERDSGS